MASPDFPWAWVLAGDLVLGAGLIVLGVVVRRKLASFGTTDGK
jgi:hypothetical protein